VTRKVTPAIRQEIIDWHAKRRALGTYKIIAAKHGICIQYVEKILREHQRSKVINALAQKESRSGFHRSAQQGYDSPDPLSVPSQELSNARQT
jgi:hypothetical protein